MNARICGAALSTLLVLDSAAQGLYFPGDDAGWETTTVAEAGVDRDRFVDAVTFAYSRSALALVFLHKGKILFEGYAGGWDRSSKGPSFSVAKSIVSVVVGQAIADGYIDGVDQASADFLTEWSGDAEKEQIRIRDHLAMATGLIEDPLHSVKLQRAKDQRRYATNLAVSYPPGERWYYHNPAYRLLFSIVEEATGMSFADYSGSRLFDRIGMVSSEWSIRVEETAAGTVSNYQWLNFTALDAARFGLLALAGGTWDGDEVVPASWLADSFSPQVPDDGWYGRLWWINEEPRHKRPFDEDVRSGPLVPDAPPDLVAALGRDDKKIYVVPSWDLVVVRLGGPAGEGGAALGTFDNEFLGRISAAFGYVPRQQPVEPILTLDEGGTAIRVPTWSGRNYTVEEANGLDGWSSTAENSSVRGDGYPLTIEFGQEERSFFRVSSWVDGAP